MAHDQHARQAIGSHRRRPRPPIEQGISPKKSPGWSWAIGLRAVEHGEMTVEDDEELVAHLALLGQHLVETDHDLVD